MEAKLFQCFSVHSFSWKCNKLKQLLLEILIFLNFHIEVFSKLWIMHLISTCHFPVLVKSRWKSTPKALIVVVFAVFVKLVYVKLSNVFLKKKLISTSRKFVDTFLVHIEVKFSENNSLIAVYILGKWFQLKKLKK